MSKSFQQYYICLFSEIYTILSAASGIHTLAGANNVAAKCSESESVYATRSTKNVQALIFLDKKRTAIVLLSFRRRYFTMGIVKIYNVLGGFTLIIVSRAMKNVYYRDAQTCINFQLFFMQYVYH